MKTKISNHQMFALAANFAIGDTIIASSSSVAALANQDAWIAALITPVIGLPFIWLYCYLGKIYSGKTLIDMIESAFGKWFGWIISAAFVVSICLLSAGQVVFYIGNFMQTEYMTETPLYALNLLLIVALVVGMLYGIEAIARSAEVFVVLVTVLMMLAIVLNLKNIHVENLLPIFEEGIAPTLKGTLFSSVFLTWPFIILLMVYPSSTEQTSKTRKALFLGYLLGAVVNFVCTIMAIMVLGSTIASRSLYPTYLMAKEISVGVITRIEGAVSFSWILSEFVRTILYFYAGTIGLCQLFKIKNHKRIVLPLGLVTLVYSGVVYPTAAYQAKWDTTTWVLSILTFGVILPILILAVTKIKTVLGSSINTQD